MANVKDGRPIIRKSEPATMLERLSDLRIFCRIVANGSLSAAAREMNISLAVVSTRLSGLEALLGVQLIHRNTRKLSLTEEGEEFLSRATTILADVAMLEEVTGGPARAPHGRLRITSSAAFGRRHIAPLVASFRARYPAVTIELLAFDSMVDLIRDGIDLAIRQSPLPDSTLMVRNLVPNSRVACASPAHVARFGMPSKPQDLVQHDCIVMGDPPMLRWPFTRNGEDVAVTVSPVFQSNDGESAHAAALSGAGVALKSRIDILDDLARGRLIDLLPDWQSPGAPIQAVYPAGRHIPQKVRAFIDFLQEALVAKIN